MTELHQFRIKVKSRIRISIKWKDGSGLLIKVMPIRKPDFLSPFSKFPKANGVPHETRYFLLTVCRIWKDSGSIILNYWSGSLLFHQRSGSAYLDPRIWIRRNTYGLETLLIKFTEIASSAPLPFGSTLELYIKVIFSPFLSVCIWNHELQATAIVGGLKSKNIKIEEII